MYQLLTKARETALAAVDAALAKGAMEPVLINVASSSSYTDYILILSAKNARQAMAIADTIEAQLKAGGSNPIGVEGEDDGQWKLIDFGDLVVHVFLHSTRLYYDLEGIWPEAPREQLNVPPELRAVNDYY